jgi:hypothetical protein
VLVNGRGSAVGRAGDPAWPDRVALYEVGVARVTETVPVHLRGVSKPFVKRLDEEKLAVLETALRKVIVDCTFRLRSGRARALLS